MRNYNAKQNVRPYQKVYEDIYEIARRRDLKLAELALAIYLRGKYCRFGNSFYQSDEFTCHELNITPKVLTKVRARLQIKGLIKFNSGNGRGNATVYTILEQLIAQPDAEKVSQMGGKVAQMGNLSFKSPGRKVAQTGDPIIIKNKEKNRDLPFQGMSKKDNLKPPRQDLESMLKSEIKGLNNIATPKMILGCLTRVPKSQHYKIKEFLIQRYRDKNSGERAYNDAEHSLARKEAVLV